MNGLKLAPTNLVIINIPVDVSELFINNVGCLKYTFNKGRESSCIEPMQLGFYPTKENTLVVGTVTKEGIMSFSIGSYTDNSLNQLLTANGFSLNDVKEGDKLAVLFTAEKLEN